MKRWIETGHFPRIVRVETQPVFIISLRRHDRLRLLLLSVDEQLENDERFRPRSFSYTSRCRNKVSFSLWSTRFLSFFKTPSRVERPDRPQGPFQRTNCFLSLFELFLLFSKDTQRKTLEKNSLHRRSRRSANLSNVSDGQLTKPPRSQTQTHTNAGFTS